MKCHSQKSTIITRRNLKLRGRQLDLRCDQKIFFMHKIDIHTHIIPEHLPRWTEKFGYGGFIHLEHHADCKAKMIVDGKSFRDIECNCWDAEQRIKECDDDHVSMQVLSTIPVMFAYWAKPKD